MDSDDSELYGDSKTIAGLQDRVDSFDVVSWWKQQGQLRDSLPQHAMMKKEESPSDAPELRNCYAGISFAWQLAESVDDFLHRLPPATTVQSDEYPWIYVCNPYVQRIPKVHASSQNIRGCEDEAPEEQGSQLLRFLEGGTERLHLLSSFMENSRASRKSKYASDREIASARIEATQDILNLAQYLGVRPGKWMLFCSPANVNAVWTKVARAVATNELGIAAKVSPKPESGDPRGQRLVCIYTRDFGDIPDLGRVLVRMKELHMFREGAKQIYYKPDCFTYLGLSTGNKWGIRPSIYSSSEILAALKDAFTGMEGLAQSLLP